MKIKTLLILPLLLVSFFLQAQWSQLKIGDKCPDVIINNVFNQQRSTIKLSDFKGKLVILDFWSKWCTPCIEAMAKMDTLQKMFPDEVYILTVTDRPLEETMNFWAANKITRNTSLPVACDDTVLHTLFKHEAKPYVAWINSDGIVAALTTTQYVTAANIRTVLDHKKTDWLVRKTVHLDYTRPMIRLNDHVPGDTGKLYYSTFMPALHGVKVYKTLKTDSVSGIKTFKMVNVPFIGFIRWALSLKGWIQLDSRLILETKDSLRFIYNKNKIYADVWDLNYKFCYEAAYPAYTKDEQIADGVLYDLERFHGIKGRVEKREMKCWVMTAMPKAKGEIPGPKGRYASPESLAGDISSSIGMPVINETNIQEGQKVFFNVYGGITLQNVKECLKYSGIRVKETVREVEVFVVSD